VKKKKPGSCKKSSSNVEYFKMNTQSRKIHSSSIIQQKYCTKTSKLARFGAQMSQISNCLRLNKIERILIFDQIQIGTIYT